MDKYFEYDEIKEYNRFILVVTCLKRHVSLWWDSLQEERRRNNKLLIKSYDRIVPKMGDNFFPKYYELIMYRHVLNL